MTVFDNIRSRNELGHAFGQLDIYWAEVRGTDRDHPEIRAAVMQRCDEAVRNAPSSWSLSRVQNLTEPDDPRSRMEKSEYVHAWETLQAELAEQEIEDRLDTIDPLTLADEEAAYGELTDQGDWRKELEYDLNRDIRHEEWTAQLDRQDTPVAELPTEPADQYLGYTDGDLVRDARSGATGRVRVRDDEEVGRYAEVAWDGSFVSDQLEVAVDNGLEREAGDPAVDGTAVELEPSEPELTESTDVDGYVALEEPTAAEQNVKGTETNPWEAHEVEPEPAYGNDIGQIRYDRPWRRGEVRATASVAQAELPTEGELNATDTFEVEAEVTAEPDQPAIAAELEADDQELDTTPDTTPAEPEPSSSWWRSKYDTVKGRVDDKYRLAKDWVAELRSGRHRQCHGAWEQNGPFGGVSECANQVAVNTFGVTVEDLRETYGHELVDDVLYRNDVQRQSFDKIADSIQRTQLEGRDVELER